MKLKILLPTLLLLLLATEAAYAQKPSGYRGKRFLFGYSLNTSSSLDAFLTKHYRYLRVDFRHGGYLEYVLERNISIGVEGSLLNSFYDYNEDEIYYNMPFRMRTAGFFLKTYDLGSDALIAPIGNYIKYGVGISNIDYTFNNAGLNEKATTFVPILSSSFGNSRIIKNNLHLDLSFEYNVIPSSFTTWLSTYQDETLTPFQHLTVDHLFSQSFSINLSVGGILF